MLKYLLLLFDWYSTNPEETMPRKVAMNQNGEAIFMSSSLPTFQTFVFLTVGWSFKPVYLQENSAKLRKLEIEMKERLKSSLQSIFRWQIQPDLWNQPAWSNLKSCKKHF